MTKLWELPRVWELTGVREAGEEITGKFSGGQLSAGVADVH